MTCCLDKHSYNFTFTCTFLKQLRCDYSRNNIKLAGIAWSVKWLALAGWMGLSYWQMREFLSLPLHLCHTGSGAYPAFFSKGTDGPCWRQGTKPVHLHAILRSRMYRSLLPCSLHTLMAWNWYLNIDGTSLSLQIVIWVLHHRLPELSVLGDFCHLMPWKCHN
jgi:hypothetical protein